MSEATDHESEEGLEAQSHFEREPIGKRLRFEIFKRDRFRCVYCGRTPPVIVLHVDHFVPVAGGGDNDPANLFTSCSDCNLGKSDKLIANALPQISPDEIDELAERVDQMQAYQHWRAEYDRQLDVEVGKIWSAWIDDFGGDVYDGDDGLTHYDFDGSRPTRKMLREYLEELPTEEIISAVGKTSWRRRKGLEYGGILPYFYGTCRNMAQRAKEERLQIRVTWTELVTALPELDEIAAEVMDFTPADPYHFCGSVLWENGWSIVFADGARQHQPSPKSRVLALLGPKGTNRDDSILGSLRAQELAISTIAASLPRCGQACTCGRHKRAPDRRDFPRCGRCNQVTEPVDERESCIDYAVEWSGQTFCAVRYGDEPELNSVKIAEKWSRWHRIKAVAPVIQPRCPGCRTPVGGVHHPGCSWEVCPVCGQRPAACRTRNHGAEELGISVAQIRARLHRRKDHSSANGTARAQTLSA
jgi:hypothetical protein